MSLWVRVVAGVAGLSLQLIVFDAAIRTFLLPRVANVRLTRLTARTVRMVFRAIVRGERTYRAKDKVLSLYASMVLLTYQALWLTLSLGAFTLGFITLGVPSFRGAFALSGSSLFGLGTVAGHGTGQLVLCYVETAVGLTLLAFLIAFIPTLYAAFQRREVSVSRLSVRAGAPATPWGVLEVAQSVKSYDRLDELWREWEQWFIEVGETHTTLTILNFYRSSTPDQTWIGCAASVLDAAALFNAAIDVTPSPTAGLCIRAGWLNLRRIADYLKVPYPTQLDSATPITITRHEFDHVIDRLHRGGVPIVPDRDAAWRDFQGWRVNYDAIIEAFYKVFTCPRTNWHDADTQPLVEPSNERGG